MMPDILMIEADHDMRNPADFLVLNKVAKEVFRVRGISRVQGITRPEGTPIDHTSIPFLLSLQSATQTQVMEFQKDRINDLLKQADDMATMIRVMQHTYEVMQDMRDTTHRMVGKMHDLQAIIEELRDRIAHLRRFLTANP